MQVIAIASSLIDLTYKHSAKDLLLVVRKYFLNLPGGQEWLERRI